MKATCVVVDEAHFGTTPEYTRVLEWQGLDRSKERVPLIGLTATPFRGTSKEETKRLAGRFGELLDRDAFDGAEPYAELAKMGVLSRVEHRVLAGSEITLDAGELEELRRTRLLPRRPATSSAPTSTATGSCSTRSPRCRTNSPCCCSARRSTTRA